MPALKSVLKEVLSLVAPSEEEVEEERQFAEKIVRKIKRACKREAVLVGSVAKGTFLKGKKDLDIFILFPPSFPKERFEEELKKIAKKVFPRCGYKLSYAEHPYLKLHYKGRSIDLVPAYKISSPSAKKSAVDRSVFHTRYVLQHLDKRKKGEVVLLKQFLKNHDLYGAEIRVKGFSGYLCELLIIHFKSFENLVKSASKWRPPVFIDFDEWKRQEALSFFAAPLIVTDPVDRMRNVAAAVSEENLKRFIALCKKLLSHPSKQLFLSPPPSFYRTLKRKRGKKYLIAFPKPDVAEDILWGQLHRLVDKLKEDLRGFEVEVIPHTTRGAVVLGVIAKKDTLSPTIVIKGPPLGMKDACRRFKKAHKKVFSKNGFLFAEEKRSVRTLKGAIKRFFRNYKKMKSHLARYEELVVIKEL